MQWWEWIMIALMGAYFLFHLAARIDCGKWLFTKTEKLIYLHVLRTLLLLVPITQMGWLAKHLYSHEKNLWVIPFLIFFLVLEIFAWSHINREILKKIKEHKCTNL